MARPAVTVRDAGPADAALLLVVWTEWEQLAPEAGVSLADAEAALARSAADPEARFLLAEVNGDVVGTMALRRVEVSPLHADPVVQTTFLAVAPAHRKHGIGSALMQEAVAWAEEKDIRYITAVSASASRETNRWLARMGLSNFASLRVAATATVRRRLEEERPLGRAGSGNLGRLLAQRRSQRRAETGVDADASDSGGGPDGAPRSSPETGNAGAG